MYFSLRWVEERLLCAYSTLFSPTPPWAPEGVENIDKPFYFNLPPIIGFTLFTPIEGHTDSLTVYIYKAETCTNISRYRRR
jgi:hypothetical protein